MLSPATASPIAAIATPTPIQKGFLDANGPVSATPQFAQKGAFPVIGAWHRGQFTSPIVTPDRHNSDVIALATSKNALELSEEDFTLVDSLSVLGVETRLVDWRDPGFNWASAGLVVVRTTWDYHLRLPEFLSWAERVTERSTLLNPLDVLTWNANKRYLQDLDSAGVPIVPTKFVARQADVVEIASEMGWPSIVIKPAVAAGAYETLVFEPNEAGEHAQMHLERLLQNGQALVQPYLDGITVEGETSLVFFDGEFHHAVRKVPQEGDFRVQIEFGGKYTVVDPTDAQLDVAQRAIACAPERPLYARVDLVDVRGTPSVMELELIEPELFFLFVPEAAVSFADLLIEKQAERLLA